MGLLGLFKVDFYLYLYILMKFFCDVMCLVPVAQQHRCEHLKCHDSLVCRRQ